MGLTSFFEKLFNNLLDKYLAKAHPPDPEGDRRFQRLMSLPIEEARAKLLKALNTPNLLYVERGPTPSNLDDFDLPPGVRELLAEYECIGTGSGTELARCWLAFAADLETHDESLRDFVRIGVDAEDEVVFVERNNEAIYQANLHIVSSPSECGVTFPSVFHWLLSEGAAEEVERLEEPASNAT